MLSVTSRLASLAFESVLGFPVAGLRRLSTGRTSEAWVADTGLGRWVARLPVEDSGRSSSFSSEELISRWLAARNCAVAEWTVVIVDGVACSVAPLLPGQPIEYGVGWSVEFADSVAMVLHQLHHLPVSEFGPLENTDTELRGRSASALQGIVDRWCRGSIWPFDQSSLDRHPACRVASDLVDRAAHHADAILAAADGFTGLAHSDLHREHLLIVDGSRLGGMLDFGDAFIGSMAWDFALLEWYFGRANTQLVADGYPGGAELHRRGSVLAIAIGFYKLAKNPGDRSAVQRLRRILDEHTRSDATS